jgi:hypothetical protein
VLRSPPNSTVSLLAIGLLLLAYATSAGAADDAPDAAERRRRAAAADLAGPVRVRPGAAADLYAAYDALAERGRPLFVSTDLALYGSLRVIDAAAAAALDEALLPAIADFSAAVLDAAIADVAALPSARARSAAAANAGLAAVAWSHATGESLPAERLAPLERGRVLALCREHHARCGADTLAGSRAGAHRIRAARLALGAALWELPGSGPITPADLLGVARAQHLAAMVSGNERVAAAWREVVRLDRLLVGRGRAEDLALDDYAALREQARAATIELDSTAARDIVRLAAEQMASRRAGAPGGAVRVLPAPHDWDDAALAELARATGRANAGALDLAVLLGSSAARERLADGGAFGDEAYRRAIDSLVVHRVAPLLSPGAGRDTHASMRALLVRALARMVEGPPAGGPDFLRDPAWRWKGVVSCAGGWVHLRSGANALACTPRGAGPDGGSGRASSAAVLSAGAGATPQHPPFLEPAPALYRDLAALAGGLEAALRASPRPQSRPIAMLSELRGLLEDAERIAYAELGGDWPAGTDAQLLADLPGRFRQIERRARPEDRAAGGSRVAWVEPGARAIGTGGPHWITVVVQAGAPAREGAVFSYYELPLEGAAAAGAAIAPDFVTARAPLPAAVERAWCEHAGPGGEIAPPDWEREWLARYR